MLRNAISTFMRFALIAFADNADMPGDSKMNKAIRKKQTKNKIFFFIA
mgnify:CR=1 FL=1